MMFVTHFTKLIQYTDWGDQLCLDALSKSERYSDAAHLQLSHSIVARILWYDRLFSRKTAYPLWEPLPLAKLKEISDQNIADWLKLLGSKADADLSETFSYVNSSGLPFTTSLHDILTHVINHSTHHRAQVVIILRQNGNVPPATDYILYIRELEKKNIR